MASSPSARRRQRSGRLSAAVACLLAASALVGAALAAGSPLLVALAAVAAVGLGIAATVTTHSVLMDSRRETNRVRAVEAQAFATISAQRTSENTAYVESMTERLTRTEGALAQVEDALCAAQHRAADSARRLKTEQRRSELAEAKTLHASRKLEDAEGRAAEAIVRVAELEHERDVLKAELDAWQNVGVEGFRRHA
ncbi:MAG: hypothetical protein U0R80_14850 [Nocardioidaceae bacterium]